MLSPYRRHLVVIVLAVVTAAAMFIVSPKAAAKIPNIGPSIRTTLHRAGWDHSTDTYYGGKLYESTYVNKKGQQAILYEIQSSLTKDMLRWSGELGFLGAGYTRELSKDDTLTVSDGRRVPVSAVIVQHLDDRQAMAYAIISPDGVTAHSTDYLMRSLWEFVHGGGPYFMLRARVQVPRQGNLAANDGAAIATAKSLLAPSISGLLTTLH